MNMGRWWPLVVLLLLITVLVICFAKENIKPKRRQLGPSKHRRKVHFHPYTKFKFFNSDTAPVEIAAEENYITDTKN